MRQRMEALSPHLILHAKDIARVSLRECLWHATWHGGRSCKRVIFSLLVNVDLIASNIEAL